MPELRKLAKEIGKNHKLAVDLWRTGIAEARILATMVDDSVKLTEEQTEDWVNVDINDSFCSVLSRPANIKVNTATFLGELLYSPNAASVSPPNVTNK